MSTTFLDLAHIAGLEHAKRALEVAASGRHSLALIGPPGVGKTLLAQALSRLLPPLEEDEYQDAVRSWKEQTGRSIPEEWRQGQRLMAVPLPTVTPLHLVGSGQGEQETISVLARHGVLCLDRLDRFSPEVVALLPTLFDRHEWNGLQLVVTLEPCPCGFYGDPLRECVCTVERIAEQKQRLSGVLERMAISVEVPRIEYERLADKRPRETSEQVRARVLDAVALARGRNAGVFNAFLSPGAIAQLCQPDSSAEKLLKAATQQLHLSPAAYHRVLCVARTIADLANSPQIQANHLAEAVQYRSR